MIAPRPRRRSAWPIGIVVLAALAVAVWQVVRRDPALSLRAPAGGSAALAPALPVAPLLPAAAADPASPKVVAQVAGVVRGADGQPLPGATVSLYRATTAWPEWQRERLERALVGADRRGRARGAPGVRQALLSTDAVVRRAAPVRPVLRQPSRVAGDQQDDHQTKCVPHTTSPQI